MYSAHFLKKWKRIQFYSFSPLTRMQSGIIKMKSDKGFGFIRPDNGQEDVFFHVSGVAGGGTVFDSLERDQAVTFDTEVGKKEKLQAINITPAAAE